MVGGCCLFAGYTVGMDTSGVIDSVFSQYGLLGLVGAIAVSGLYKQWQDVNITVSSAKASQDSAAESREMLRKATDEASEAYREVIESMKLHIASQEEVIARVRAENGELRKVNTALAEDMRRVSEAYGEAMESIQRGEVQRKELLERLTSLQSVLDSVQAENAEMRSKIERLTAKVESLRQSAADFPVDNPGGAV